MAAMGVGDLEVMAAETNDFSGGHNDVDSGRKLTDVRQRHAVEDMSDPQPHRSIHR